MGVVSGDVGHVSNEQIDGGIQNGQMSSYEDAATMRVNKNDKDSSNVAPSSNVAAPSMIVATRYSTGKHN